MYEQCVIKRKPSRILSILLAVVMVLSVTVLPAAAATSVKKTVTSTAKIANVTVKTGKGILYSLGLKKTTVTFKNESRYYSVDVFQKTTAGPKLMGTLTPGQTKTLSLSGSAKTYSLFIQRKNTGTTTVSVSVNAGSVS